jgi:3-deoxy-D-manno-octulosonic-acid transferase
MRSFGRAAAWAVYEAAVCSSWPVLFLYYVCRSGTDGKYGSNYPSRLGLRLPPPLKSGAKRAWVHALSVGEVLSSVPLVAEIKRLGGPDLEIVFSTSTETGMSIAAERLQGLVDRFFFMPHDFPWTVDRLLDRVKPSVFVLIETDFWPNLIWGLKRRGVPAVLVNGRLSPRSYLRYARLGGFAEVMFGGFGLIFAQTELDKSRFISMGGLSDRVVAAGNLKFESSIPRVPESEKEAIRTEIGLEENRPVWVAGSTHEGEEQIALGIHQRLSALIPGLLLVIAPRKPQRGIEIAAVAAGLGFDCAMRSRGEKAAEKSVFILDTLGELSRIYAVCNIAFLGGSFVEIGGHNPLEAIAQGRPACWGPHFFNFSEIERELLEAGCAMRVSSERELEDFLEKTLVDGGGIAKMTEAAESFAGSRRHASSRIASMLIEMMQ